MTKQEVQRLFEMWRFFGEDGVHCYCATHEPENKNVCKREQAWRDYCEARDQFLNEHKHLIRKPGFKDIVGDLLNTFEGMN